MVKLNREWTGKRSHTCTCTYMYIHMYLHTCVFPLPTQDKAQLCHFSRRDQSRAQRMERIVSEYHVTGIVNERVKKLIQLHCSRRCVDTTCKVPHRAAGW